MPALQSNLDAIPDEIAVRELYLASLPESDVAVVVLGGNLRKAQTARLKETIVSCRKAGCCAMDYRVTMLDYVVYVHHDCRVAVSENGLAILAKISFVCYLMRGCLELVPIPMQRG